jgi:hypothetical protein
MSDDRNGQTVEPDYGRDFSCFSNSYRFGRSVADTTASTHDALFRSSQHSTASLRLPLVPSELY